LESKRKTVSNGKVRESKSCLVLADGDFPNKKEKKQRGGSKKRKAEEKS